jgi:hypothetical protein
VAHFPAWESEASTEYRGRNVKRIINCKPKIRNIAKAWTIALQIEVGHSIDLRPE